MMPHEWLELPDGRLLKLDGSAHGDDHFFPGPCDIAWDLAGTIVEWKLTAPEAEYFLEEYRRAQRRRCAHGACRLPEGLCLFPHGMVQDGGAGQSGSFDEPLLWRDFERYRRYAGTTLRACRVGGASDHRAEAGEPASGAWRHNQSGVKAGRVD